MKIFLDLDGVFADLDSLIKEICGDVPRFSNDIWPVLAKEWRPFWRLEVMPDSHRLVTMLQHHSLEFLTACPESRPGQGHGLVTAADDKRAWVSHNRSRTIPVNTIVGGKNKPVYLQKHPGAVLIDDYDRNINLWIAAGGVGILHTSVDDTLDQLDRIGLLE